MNTRPVSSLSITSFAVLALPIAACQADSGNAANVGAEPAAVMASDKAAGAGASAEKAKPFKVEVMADFEEPWAMTFLPGNAGALVTEKAGKLMHWKADGKITEIAGAPEVAYGGQGGLGDVVLGPDYAQDKRVYLSWAEAGRGATRGAVVGRATLDLDADQPALRGLEIIWTQYPKVTGEGHYGHRIAFSPDGKYMFVASGERQKFDPAQDMDSNMGKVVRLFPDGSIPQDNPFFDAGNKIRSQIWSLGHRNPLGLTFDGEGNLWNHEMGPAGGDELNLVQRGANYGYPKVSNGDHYDGTDIPDHSEGDGFTAPTKYWNPAISPAGLIYYDGKAFPAWKGSLFIGGLGAEYLLRVTIDGDAPETAESWWMEARIREVEQGPDGAIWLLEDGGNRGSQGRLLKLTPKP